MFENTRTWLKADSKFTRENIFMLAFIAYMLGVVVGSV